MHKAYDTILQSEVEAIFAAKSAGFEPYRYTCACCGEEVHICAADSIAQVAHFRHRSGNNDAECDEYLGNNSAISIALHSRRSNCERVEIYYSNITKTFSLGVRFSLNEIDYYEQNNIDFEIRTKDSAYPFYTLPINKVYFTPDISLMIQLTDFSYNYCISNTLTHSLRKYEFFKKGRQGYVSPSFFKIQGCNDDNNYNAKLVRSKVLFTNTQYLLVFPSQYNTVSFSPGVDLGNPFVFESMGKKFCGMTISFLNKCTQIEEQLYFWDYSLEASETLTLLWPPAPIVNDSFQIQSNTVFLYSSFMLQAHGNINVHSSDILKNNDGISRISINQKTKIIQKNAEVAIDMEEHFANDIVPLVIPDCVASSFLVPDDGLYFLFDDFGTRHLKAGQVALLTKNGEIRMYDGNYCVERINYCPQGGLEGKELMQDIQYYYKRTVPCDRTCFTDVPQSVEVAEYINTCKLTGIINAVTSQYILEGIL